MTTSKYRCDSQLSGFFSSPNLTSMIMPGILHVDSRVAIPFRELSRWNGRLIQPFRFCAYRMPRQFM